MYRPGEPFDEIVEMEVYFERRRRRQRTFAVVAAIVVIAMLLLTVLPSFLRAVRSRPDPPSTTAIRALDVAAPPTGRPPP